MKINNEIKIGVMVFIALSILAAMTIKVSSFNLKKEGYYLRSVFNNIDGVNLNSPVMLNGYEVGIVDDILIVDREGITKIELLLWIDSKARLRKGATAYVKNLGFMGEKYIGLVSSDQKSSYLEDNAMILGEDPPNFDELINQGKDIASEIKEVVSNLNERLTTNSKTVDDILTNTNITMKSMSSVIDNIDGILDKNKGEIDSLISNMNALSVNLEELSYDLKLHPWKILYKSKGNKRSLGKEE